MHYLKGRTAEGAYQEMSYGGAWAGGLEPDEGGAELIALRESLLRDE